MERRSRVNLIEERGSVERREMEWPEGCLCLKVHSAYCSCTALYLLFVHCAIVRDMLKTT